LDEPYSGASSNLFRKISEKPDEAVHFWRSWQAFIKHAATNKRQIALHFWDFSTSFKKVFIEFANAADSVDFER
jgi:hypothetical protein